MSLMDEVDELLWQRKIGRLVRVSIVRPIVGVLCEFQANGICVVRDMMGHYHYVQRDNLHDWPRAGLSEDLIPDWCMAE